MRFWDASKAALQQIAKFSTATCFSGDELDSPPEDAEAEVDEDEWPPFRKVSCLLDFTCLVTSDKWFKLLTTQVGLFDPYSDDPRLAVKKLCLCPITGLLSVAGTAGQVVVAEFSDAQNEKELPVITYIFFVK